LHRNFKLEPYCINLRDNYFYLPLNKHYLDLDKFYLLIGIGYHIINDSCSAQISIIKIWIILNYAVVTLV